MAMQSNQQATNAPAPRVFLSAEWKNLLMANYAIDPVLLQPYLPYRTELDSFEGIHYVSMVGFLFANVKVKGVSIPFHTNFEEVNLRFYVRFKEAGTWKRGVVFIKEIVPRTMITFVANTLYGENYATHPMRHSLEIKEGEMHLAYQWKVGREWNYLHAKAATGSQDIVAGSAEEFITEHYWGYTQVSPSQSGEYQVAHPRWQVYPVRSFESLINAERLYGPGFAEALNQNPLSVFVAKGSAVQVMAGKKIR